MIIGVSGGLRRCSRVCAAGIVAMLGANACVTPPAPSTAPSLPAAFEHSSVPSQQPASAAEWYRSFGSDELVTLVDARQQLQYRHRYARGALAVLAGHDPEAFDVATRTLEQLKALPIAAGLPAALLTRRPDLAAAEAGLTAARADVAVARASLLPILTLTGSGGVQNPAVQAAATTLAGTGPTLVLGASLLQAMFDGGRRGASRSRSSGQ